MTNNWIRLTINGQQLIGDIYSRGTNELYVAGKSATYNEIHGGYTYYIACVSSNRDTAYGDLTIEIKSNMFTALGIEYITDDERRTFMKARKVYNNTDELPDFGFGRDD